MIVEMKVCSACKETKSLSKFNKDSSRKDGLQYWCTECSRKRYRETDHVNTREYGKQRVADTKEKMVEYLKNKQCINCGEDDHIVFDFHHVDPSKKDFIISGGYMRKWEKILIEINKCVILCANCHRRVHQGTIKL